jgi:hypothetical protein
VDGFNYETCKKCQTPNTTGHKKSKGTVPFDFPFDFQVTNAKKQLKTNESNFLANFVSKYYKKRPFTAGKSTNFPLK